MKEKSKGTVTASIDENRDNCCYKKHLSAIFENMQTSYNSNYHGF